MFVSFSQKCYIFVKMSILKFQMMILFLVALVAVSCSNSESYHEDDLFVDAGEFERDSVSEMFFPENMILIASSKQQVVLGCNGSGTKLNEKPEMKVVLNYNYFMDVHEVTCGEFISVMNRYGSAESFARTYKCLADSLPVVDVTYFDAVLFANAKSVANHADTVYSYSGATFDEDGHCSNLNGLVFHADRKGFRLPTEAEWIKAASGDFDASNSWHNGNSEFEVHKVCSKRFDKLGFCDFAGNVMEWVNDWLGELYDTTVINYVGASDGGSIGERIVKGGAFNTEIANINTFSRGDVYMVTSSTRANYVGFRLAYGSIPDPVWIGNDGTAKKSVINLLASSSDIYTYTKSYNVKLAFRNDESGNLAFVDYANGSLSVTEILDTIDAYHPEISPDGNKVAFCSKLEGVSGKSALYVRNLDKEGSELVKLDVPSAAIPRWRVLDGGDTVITYVTDAGSNKNEAAWKKYSTWRVRFAEGKFGEPQKIMDGAFHGGVDVGDRLAVTGAQLLRARVNRSDTLWYNGEQACNVSLSQDGSRRTVFLDFGGKTGQAYVGKMYGAHQNLFVADSTGKLIQYVMAPEGLTFDHSEWAVGSVKDNVVATLSNSDGAHQKIVLINLEENSIIELLEGEELWQPSLWIKSRKIEMTSSSSEELKDSWNSSSSMEELSDSIIYGYEFDIDSAGMYYNNSGACNYALYYRYKMELLWRYKDSANVVVVGSSRPYNGVMPFMFQQPIVAVNLAVPVGILSGSKYILENYVIPHYKRLKVVIMSIDLDRGTNAGRNANNMFYTSYESYPGYVYDKNHNFWKGYDTESLYYATYDALGSNDLASVLRSSGGYSTGVGSSSWGKPTVDDDSTKFDREMNLFEMNKVKLDELIQTCQKNGIILVGVLFPMNPRYKETGAFGRHGLRRSIAPTIISELQKLSDLYSNFILFDENKMGNHDYTDEMARDVDHLNDLGAVLMTERLDSLLKQQTINWNN